jgi:nitroreductase
MQSSLEQSCLDLLATRRSLNPQFMTGRGPGSAELNQLLTLATRVPDHGKLAPWRFIVFEGEARIRAGAIIEAAFLADKPHADDEVRGFERNRLSRAPLVVAVVSKAASHPKIPEWEQALSAGAVCLNLSIAARAMGFYASWLTEWYGYDRRVLTAFGLAPEERIAGFIHIGMSDVVPKERDRPALDQIVMRF